jgi:hypothetical protein
VSAARDPAADLVSWGPDNSDIRRDYGEKLAARATRCNDDRRPGGDDDEAARTEHGLAPAQDGCEPAEEIVEALVGQVELTFEDSHL